MPNDDEVIAEIVSYVRSQLSQFARSKQSGMIQVDVTLSQGQPTGINTTARENRKIIEKRERHPV